MSRPNESPSRYPARPIVAELRTFAAEIRGCADAVTDPYQTGLRDALRALGTRLEAAAARQEQREQKRPPTPAQGRVLDWVRAWIAAHPNRSPSHQEIADALWFASLASVCEHLDSLEAKGHIRRTANTVRSLVLVEP